MRLCHIVEKENTLVSRAVVHLPYVHNARINGEIHDYIINCMMDSLIALRRIISTSASHDTTDLCRKLLVFKKVALTAQHMSPNRKHTLGLDCTFPYAVPAILLLMLFGAIPTLFRHQFGSDLFSNFLSSLFQSLDLVSEHLEGFAHTMVLGRKHVQESSDARFAIFRA